MTSHPPIHACVFDLDGTLVDTLSDFHVSINHMLRALGRPELTREAVGIMVGKGGAYLLHSALLYPTPLSDAAAAAIDPALYDRARMLYTAEYERINGRYAAVFPGVVAGLTALKKRGLALACLTNKPAAHAKVLLDLKGLTPYFRQIFGGDSFARKKPDPLPLQETCKALGVAPADTVMVGDSVNDAGAGHAAGSAVALVSYGYNHGRPVREIAAEWYLDSLVELGRLVG